MQELDWCDHLRQEMTKILNSKWRVETIYVSQVTIGPEFIEFTYYANGEKKLIAFYRIALGRTLEEMTFKMWELLPLGSTTTYGTERRGALQERIDTLREEISVIERELINSVMEGRDVEEIKQSLSDKRFVIEKLEKEKSSL